MVEHTTYIIISLMILVAIHQIAALHLNLDVHW
jgi:hypothetical protein